VAVLLKASSAVTVKPKELAAVTLLGAATAKCVAALGLTAIALEAAVRLLVAVSVANNVCLPTVVKTALKTPTPLVSLLLTGRDVLGPVSVLENVTMPL
jgi:hypothetical protein